MQIKINDDVYNQTFIPYLEDNRKYQVYYGGAGSGKSYFIAQKIIWYLLSKKGFNWMVVRHTAADNHDSTFAQLKQVINLYGLREFFKVNESRGQEVIKYVGNNNSIIFKGLDDVEKRKGVTFENGILQGIWIEEASETTEHNLNQLDLRLRGASELSKVMAISFNPVDENHWLKRRFFDIPLDETLGFTFKSTYLDNEFLTVEDAETLEAYKSIDEYYYQVYCLGNWGNISNAKVFKNVQVMDFDYKEEDLQNVRHGMDFGYVHASTLMSGGYRDGSLYVYAERYYKEHTNRQFIEAVAKSGFDIRNEITADNAEPDRIREWKDSGYDVTGAKKPKGSLKDSIDYLQSLPKIYIHKTNCPNAAREFLNFKRRELKDGTITETFVELDDDTIAAVRYFSEEFWNSRYASVGRW